MCINTSKYALLHCGREYGFAENNEQPRATELHFLFKEEIANLPIKIFQLNECFLYLIEKLDDSRILKS